MVCKENVILVNFSHYYIYYRLDHNAKCQFITLLQGGGMGGGGGGGGGLVIKLFYGIINSQVI